MGRRPGADPWTVALENLPRLDGGNGEAYLQERAGASSWHRKLYPESGCAPCPHMSWARSWVCSLSASRQGRHVRSGRSQLGDVAGAGGAVWSDPCPSPHLFCVMHGTAARPSGNNEKQAATGDSGTLRGLSHRLGHPFCHVPIELVAHTPLHHAPPWVLSLFCAHRRPLTTRLSN